MPTASNTIIPAPLKTLSPSMYFEVSFPCPQRTTDWLEIGFVQTGKEGQFYGFYFEFESASIYISTPTEPKVVPNFFIFVVLVFLKKKKKKNFLSFY